MGNYSLKNITLGIGIGLVLSSMINISAGSRELTVEEIKKEAAKYNLIVLAKEDILTNQTPTTAPTITPTPTAVPTPTPAAAAKPAVVTPAPTPKAPAVAGKVNVSIKGGMVSEDIADLLKEKGLIKDTKAFMKRLGELGREDKLQVGDFEISKGLSYDAIIKVITR
jgi:hypothetical protein